MDGKGPHGNRVREEMETLMMEKVGIFRNEKDLCAAEAKMKELRGRWTEVRTQDKSRRFNTDLLGILELENLVDLAYLTTAAARARTESRGAHARDDFPGAPTLRGSVTALRGSEMGRQSSGHVPWTSHGGRPSRVFTEGGWHEDRAAHQEVRPADRQGAAR